VAISKQVDNVVLVPKSALHQIGEGKYAVSVSTADGTLETRQVEIGLQGEQYGESGLQVGQW
jgi:multidrug efflux pump subunit AcrA (membrane-fusion protein)